MRALVTGASGFVGHHLVQHLNSCGDEILATFLGSEPKDYPCNVIPLDVCDGPACADMFRRFRPEVVYHLAGIAFVPEAESDFDRTLHINVAGTANVFRQCHLLELGARVVLVSSAEVYGPIGPDELPIKENTPTRPANNYSLSKRMAELVAERYDRVGSVHGIIVRPFNHIGAGQDVRFVASSFADQLASIAKKKSPPLMRVGNLDAQRDFSDVRDIVRAYRLCAEKGRGIYNLGSGCAVPIQEILTTLIEISGLSVQIEIDPSRVRKNEVPVVYGSIEKAKTELGWEPSKTLRETLSWLYSHALEQKNS